ncbi:MAG: hypothetical protein R3B96_24065 [Pirellulaceae bacterium]
MSDSMNLIPSVDELSTKLKRETVTWLPVWIVAAFVMVAFLTISNIQAIRFATKCAAVDLAIGTVTQVVQANRDLADQVSEMEKRLESHDVKFAVLPPFEVLELVMSAIEQTGFETQCDSIDAEADDLSSAIRIRILGTSSSMASSTAFFEHLQGHSNVFDIQIHSRPNQQSGRTRPPFDVEFSYRLRQTTGDAT